MPNVVFDDESARRIAAAVKYVEGLQNPEDQPEDETNEQEPRRILKGTFGDVWRSGTSKTVNCVSDNGSTVTKTATNYGPDVEGPNCVIVLAGGSWVLVWAGLAEHDTAVTSVEIAGSVGVVTAVEEAGSVEYVKAVADSDGVEVVTGITDTGVEVVTKVEAAGSNPYVQTINNAGTKTFLSSVSFSGDVVTSVQCVDNELVVSTAPLADLATVTEGTVSFADLASAQEAFLELSDIATITSETLAASDFGTASKQTLTLSDLGTTEAANLTLGNLATVTTQNLAFSDFANTTTSNITYYGPPE